MYQCDESFPPVARLSATVLRVSGKFIMLSPTYEHWSLKGHELQQENDKMNMKCQRVRRDVMVSLPEDKLSQTFPFPIPFFKPGRVTSQQLTCRGLPPRQNSTCANPVQQSCKIFTLKMTSTATGSISGSSGKKKIRTTVRGAR